MPTTRNPASRVCGPNNPDSEWNFYCSLVCCGKDRESKGIGWPMTSGTLQISLYGEKCHDGSYQEPIFYVPPTYQIPLSCPRGASRTSYTCTWIGEALNVSSNHGSCGPNDGRGFTLRLRGSMTAIDFNTVSASFTLERLVPGFEFIPPASTAWTSCASGSATCYRVVSPGVDPNDKQIPRTFVSNMISVGSGSPVCGDAKYARLTVILLPYRFGCVDPKNDKYCAFAATGSYYSCLRAVVRPSVYNTFAPALAQMGVNTATCGPGQARCGCFNGKLLDGGSYSLAPADSDPLDLLQIGCPGENVNKIQQIQRTYAGNYEVLVKAIEGTGSLCVACRKGFGNPWTVGTVAEYQGFTPWVGTASFPTVDGQPEVLLYGLKFPGGIAQDCVVDGIFGLKPSSLNGPYLVADGDSSPIVWDSVSTTGAYIYLGDETESRTVLDMPPVDPPPIIPDSDIRLVIPEEDQIRPAARPPVDPTTRDLMRKISLRLSNQCKHLGEILAPAACCGTTELRACAIHGRCRMSGVPQDKEKICVLCDDWVKSDA